MSSLGEAFINVHADTSGMEREIHDGTKKAGDEAEAQDDFGGFVKAADKAGKKAGTRFVDSMGRTVVVDANGRWRDIHGKFLQMGDKVGTDAGAKVADSMGKTMEKSLHKKISSFGTTLAPPWLRTIALWAGLIGPGVVMMLKQLAPLTGLAGALVPLAIGGAASLFILKSAFSGVGKAMADAGTNQKAYLKDLAKMTPAQRALTKEMVKAKPAFESFKNLLADNFLRGFSGTISTLTSRLIPGLEDSLGNLSFTLGDMAKKLATTLSSKKSTGNLDQIFIGFADALHRATPGLQKFLDALLVIGKDATPLLNSLAAAFTRVMTRFDTFINKMDKNGKLTKFFNDAFKSLQGLGPVLKDVVSIFKDLFSAAPAGGGALTVVIHALAGFIHELSTSGALTVIFQAYVQFFTTLSAVLKPLLPVLSQLIIVLGDAFVSTLKALQPSLVALATGFAKLVEAIAPSLPPLLAALTPILVTLAQGLADLFTQNSGQLGKTLATVLKLVAESLRTMLPFVQQAVPLILALASAFLDLVDPVINSGLGDLLNKLNPTTVALQALSPVMSGLTFILDGFAIALGDRSTGVTHGLLVAGDAITGMNKSGMFGTWQKGLTGAQIAAIHFGQTTADVMNGIKGPVHVADGAFDALGAGVSRATGVARRALVIFRINVVKEFNTIDRLLSQLSHTKFSPIPIPVVGQPKVKAHARGTITSGPEFALIGEGGSPEVLLPTNDPGRARQLLNDSGLAAQLGVGAPVVNVSVMIGNDQLNPYIDTRIERADASTAALITAGTRS